MTMEKIWELVWQGLADTAYMTFPSALFAYLLGLPLGILLVITQKGHIRPAPTFNAVLGGVVNFLRSIPFLILLVMLFPVTRVVMGTAIGTRSIIFPLVVSAFPYVARMVEGSLKEVDAGVIEAAQSMGCTNFQIVSKVLLPESKPSLINGAVISMVTILGYSAMAATIGGTGLGQVAIIYGHQRSKADITWVCVLLIVAIVQVIQIVGTHIARRTDKRIK